MTRVLLVCLGNICRSPLAQGVLEQRLRVSGLFHSVRADSAGTHGYHLGEPPDPRAVEAAARRGYDISGQRARRVRDGDFQSFDYILAMDQDNLQQLTARCPAAEVTRLRLLMDFAPGPDRQDVPDPYYGGGDGFERALDLIEAAVDGLILELKARES
ncbi:MAG: low molecular weight phosphotyrosine protein phosphatase [Gammaproteobacteria bacterium]|nr:low molecular weight phosphotyrosine protein phosphatase [Gammaproteobacteria bacterium]